MGASLSQDQASEPNYEESSNTISQSSNTDAKPNQSNTQVQLPQNCEDILKHADSPVDRSSAKKLLEQLHAGVFLNQKRKKYWVDQESNHNCFILFARDLSITWGEDDRFWHWPLLKESSDESLAVAELLDVCWLEVHGKFEIANLSPGATYEISFVVKLKDPAYGWENPVNLRLTLPDGSKQEHKENLMEKPRGKWIEITAGELKSSAEKAGEMEFSLYEYEGGKWKKGLLIKGVAIRPKA
ncbi:hypothetical protein ACP275_13G198600 [Erythranthe tilingii]